MDMNKLIDFYIQLRDRKKDIQTKHREELEAYDAGLMKLEAKMQEQLTQLGVDKLGGDAGTVFTKTNVSVSVEDWDEVIEYVKCNDAYDLLEKRVSKTAAQERGDVPGLRTTQVKTIQVRRK